MTQEHEVREAVKFTKVARQGVGCQGLGAGGGHRQFSGDRASVQEEMFSAGQR